MRWRYNDNSIQMVYPPAMKVFFTILKHRIFITVMLLTGFACAHAGEINVVAFGTSFTNGKGVSRSDAWPAQLEGMLKADGFLVVMDNQGMNGDSTDQLLRRVDSAVPAKTDVVIFEHAFGNDQRAGLSQTQTVNNCEEIIRLFANRNLPVLLIVRGYSAAELEARMALFDEIVKKYGVERLGIEQPDSTLLADRKHPSAKAHRDIAETMLAPVERLIKRRATGNADK